MGEAADVALKELDTALTQCPALTQAHAERARLLLRTGKPAQALLDLQVAEREAPNDASLQQILAQAYRAVGDQAHATAALHRFQQLELAEHTAKERRTASVLSANP